MQNALVFAPVFFWQRWRWRLFEMEIKGQNARKPESRMAGRG